MKGKKEYEGSKRTTIELPMGLYNDMLELKLKGHNYRSIFVAGIGHIMDCEPLLARLYKKMDLLQEELTKLTDKQVMEVVACVDIVPRNKE